MRGGNIYHATRDIWIGTGAGEHTPEIRYLLNDDLAQLRRCLVEPSSQAELVESLQREHLVFLRGQPRTGRRMAALAALLTWVGTDSQPGENGERRLVGIIPPPRTSLHLFRPEMLSDRGYLFEPLNTGDAASFETQAETFKHLAAERHSRVVALTPADWNPPGRVVDHRPPNSWDVFHCLLVHEATAAGVDADLIDDELLVEINEELALETSPAKAAQRASWLIAGVRTGRTTAELRAELPRRVHDDVRRRLDEGGPVLGRCFMTSAAVLNGLPETTVSAAAVRLADRINREKSVRREDPLPPWQHLSRWLTYAGATTRNGNGAGTAPTVHLGPRVEVATLRVLWQDQPTIRRPLLTWLRGIAESDDTQARTKAAHAIGVLARFNLDLITDEFINSWARSPRLRDHQLAAMVLESAVGDPDIAPRVYFLLQVFAAGTLGRRLVAAHAYGSRIGLDAPDLAMRELRKIAIRSDSEVGKAVAGSIGNLYSMGTAPQILGDLARWIGTGSPGGLYTSALAFVRLALIRNASPTRPPLTQLDPDGGLTRDLAALWRNSLTLRLPHSGTRTPRLVVPDSWQVLAWWMSRYEEETGIRTVIDEIVQHATEHERLQRALLIHFRHWRYRRLITADVHTQLLELMKAGKTCD